MFKRHSNRFLTRGSILLVMLMSLVLFSACSGLPFLGGGNDDSAAEPTATVAAADEDPVMTDTPAPVAEADTEEEAAGDDMEMQSVDDDAAEEDDAAPQTDLSAAQTGTVVRVQPGSGNLNLNGTTVLEIRVENVSDLYAADLELRFDPAVLQVQDSDGSRDGVQIAPGTFPNPDFVAENIVDNATGVVRYALTQLPPSSPLNGSGLMASVTFQGVGNGVSNITISSFALATNQGQSIAATVANGTLTVGSGGPTATPTPQGPTPTPIPGTATPTPTPIPGGATPTATPPSGVNPTATPAPGTDIRYVIKSGDTLFSIARRYGLTVAQLAAYNNITNINLIYAGQVIYIPGTGGGTPGTGSTYVVQRGDTLFSIARRYGLTVAQLAAYNNIFNPNLIYVGETLQIPPR